LPSNCGWRANPLSLSVLGVKQLPVPLGDDFDGAVGHFYGGLIVNRVSSGRIGERKATGGTGGSEDAGIRFGARGEAAAFAGALTDESGWSL